VFTLRKALFLLGLTVASLGALGQSASAAPIILDNFTAASGSWNPVTAPGTLQTQGVAGSPRTLVLNAPGLLNGGDFLGVGGGTFSFQSNSGSTYSASLGYTFAPLALQAGNQLGIDFNSLDAGSNVTNQISALLEVTTSTGTLFKNILFSEGTFNYLIGLNGLSGIGNLNSTTGIRLTFNNTNDQGVDFVINGQPGIRIFGDPEPEPATLATFGLIGLMGGFVARRKLKGSAAVQV
jgi:hypothetical protein